MTNIFLRLLSTAFISGWLIIAVVILRFIFKRAPKWIACFLWMIVGIRLVLPFNIESGFSFIPKGVEMSYNNLSGEMKAGGEKLYNVNDNKNNVLNLHNDHGIDMYVKDDTEKNKGTDISGDAGKTVKKGEGIKENAVRASEGNISKKINILNVLNFIWLAGVLAMMSYLVISYGRLARRVETATKLRNNIWECDFVDSPFILGVLSPKIFIPYHLGEDKLLHVLAHENAHIKRKDHIYKLLAFLILCVYWFHPLVWLGYALLCRDIEMACDERVIKEMKQGERKEYQITLLDLSTPKQGLDICPLAFGEVGIKERIVRVKKYKKTPLWVITGILLTCAVVVTGCFAAPKGENDVRQDEKGTPYTSDGTEDNSDNGTDKNNAEDNSDNGTEGNSTVDSSDNGTEGNDSVEVSDDGTFVGIERKLASHYIAKQEDAGPSGIYMRAGLWLDKENMRFSFSYDLLSSYMPYGSFTVDADTISCVTDDGLYNYYFKIKDDNTLRLLTEASSTVGLIDEKISGISITSETVFKPGYGVEDNKKKNVEIKGVDLEKLDLRSDAGADGTQLYYADEEKIIFGGCYGLFVYDRSEGRIVNSLDLDNIGCSSTQGDNYCEIASSLYGEWIYMHPVNGDKLYIFKLDEDDTGKLYLYDYPKGISIFEDSVFDLCPLDYSESVVKVKYEKDGKIWSCTLEKNGFGTIGDATALDRPVDNSEKEKRTVLFESDNVLIFPPF